MNKASVEMGWGARPLKEQFPMISENDAQHLDRDNQDFHRLKVRGLITDVEARSIRKRYAKSVEEAIKAASSKP